MEKNFKQGGLAINKEQIKLKTSKNSKNVSVKMSKAVTQKNLGTNLIYHPFTLVLNPRIS